MYTLKKIYLPLASILVFQALISVLALRNTAFQDEALYLFAGREIFFSWIKHAVVAEHYGRFFAGFPNFYPVIGGLLDMVGHVEAARMFNTACMLAVTACVYVITKTLINRESAMFAAVLYAFQAPVLYIGRLATHDALSLALLAASITAAITAGKTSRLGAALLAGPLLLAACATKYSAILFVPTVIAISILWSLNNQDRKHQLVLLGLSILSTIVMACILYLVIDKDVLAGLKMTTTQRIALIRVSRLYLLSRVFIFSGFSFMLGFAGLIMKRHNRLLFLILFGSAFLAPTYHVYKAEAVSLEKHLAIAQFFLIPLAGYFISRMIGFSNRNRFDRYHFAGLAICLLSFSLGLPLAQNLYHQWQDSSNLTYVLRTQVRPGNTVTPHSGRYLAESFEVSRYYLQDITSSWQWVGLDFFSYTDKEGRYHLGKDAYLSAIREGYFDPVELNYGYDAATAVAIGNELRSDPRYTLIAKLPFQQTSGNGYDWIWRKN